MNTTLTPPAQPTQPATAAPRPVPPPRNASRVISTIAIVTGALVIAGTAGGITLGALANGAQRNETAQVSTAGVTSISANLSAASVDVELRDVEQASLAVSGTKGLDDWTFENRDGVLVINSPTGWSFGNWFSDQGQEVTLILPARLGGKLPDASFTLNAGDLDLAGAFGELDVQLNAGQVDVEGAADTFGLSVSAGGADVELSAVASATLDLSAGSVDAEFTGSAPDDVTINVSAGTLALTLPADEYRVTSDVSAGGFTNDLRTSSSADRLVDVTVSAGNVHLESDD